MSPSSYPSQSIVGVLNVSIILEPIDIVIMSSRILFFRYPSWHGTIIMAEIDDAANLLDDLCLVHHPYCHSVHRQLLYMHMLRTYVRALHT